MNKETMQQLILEALSKKLGDSYHISIQKVLKTNVKLDGLTILQDGKNITPAIYLDPFYKDLENGTSLEDVVNGILQTYFAAQVHPFDFDIASVLNFACVKDRLYVELVNRHSNEELLQDVPHTLFLDDFAIIVRCLIDTSENGNASFLVHSNHLKMWHIEQETLMSIAILNTRKLFGLDLRNMNDVIREMISIPETDNNSLAPMWVMTNKRRLSGAATVLFSDVLKDFAEKHGNFYVIFSSVHEVLLLLTPDNSDIDSITKMNQEVNATQVEADEVLGTKAYYYSKDIGFVL